MVPVKRNERYRARTHTTVLIMFVSQLNRMFQPLAENMKKTPFCPYLFLDKKVTNFDKTIFWVVSLQKEAIRQIAATLVILITPLP